MIGAYVLARKNHLNSRKMLSIWTVINTDCIAMVTPPVWSVCYVIGSGMIEKSVENLLPPSVFLAFLVPLNVSGHSGPCPGVT